MKKAIAILLIICLSLSCLMSCTLVKRNLVQIKNTADPSSETEAPTTDIVETEAPATDVPETLAPATDVPETLAPVTAAPTAAPTAKATAVVTAKVTAKATVKATAVPTKAPTAKVTVKPTATPTPTVKPQETAHVIFLLGQSNAVGATLHCILYPAATVNAPAAVDAATYSKYLNTGISTKIKMMYFAEAGGSNGSTHQCSVSLTDPVTKSADKLFKTVKLGQSYSTDHFGPEVGIAYTLAQKYPNEKFYIIKCAKGGISINDSWLNNGYCYTNMKKLWEIALQSFEIGNMIPEVDAIVWVQGENEGQSQSSANNYYSYQSDLAQRLRTLFAPYAKKGGIRFVDSGISTYWSYYQTINNAKQQFANSSSLNYFFNPNDKGYTWNTDPDGNYAHWDARYVLELGKELGKLVY